MRKVPLFANIILLFASLSCFESTAQSPAQNSESLIKGVGCVEPGVEGGCLIIRDTKSKTTYDVFFKGTPPKVDTAISFEGVPNNNPNICIQNQALTITNWTPLKLLCPLPETSNISASDTNAGVPECTKWSSWYNVQPGGPKSLHVTGTCMLRVGSTASLVPSVPQGFNPSIYLLNLAVTSPVGHQSNAIVQKTVTYSENTDTRYDSVQIDPLHVTVPVKIIH